MNQRKNPMPKRHLLLPPLTHASSLPSKKKAMRKRASKFFFDMLCCLDADVVAKYIVPHIITVPSSSSSSSKEEEECWSVIAPLYGCVDAGLLRRNPMQEVFFPAFACIQGMEVRTSTIFQAFGLESFDQAMLDLHEKAHVGLVFDILQCSGCMFPSYCCKFMKRKLHRKKYTCVSYLKILHDAVLSRRDPLPIKSLFINGIDSGTAYGANMIQLIMEIVIHSLHNNPYVRASVGELDLVRNAPKSVCYNDICMKRSNIEPFESLFQVCSHFFSFCVCLRLPDDDLPYTQVCSKNCDSLTIKDPVILGGASDPEDRSFPIELFHQASFGAKMCRIKTLRLDNVVFPSSNDYQLRKVCESIANMQMLESLEIVTWSRSYTGSFHLLRVMERYFSKENINMPSLKHITLFFAGYVPVSMDSYRVLTFVDGTMCSTHLVQAFLAFPSLESIDVRDITENSWGSIMVLNGIFHVHKMIFPSLTSFSFTFPDVSDTNMRALDHDVPFWDHISQQQYKASFWAGALSYHHMPQLEQLHIRCTGTPLCIVDLCSFLLKLCDVRRGGKRIKEVHVYSCFLPAKLLTPLSDIRKNIAENLAENFCAHSEVSQQVVRTYTPGSFV
jgi:hypothetical protein